MLIPFSIQVFLSIYNMEVQNIQLSSLKRMASVVSPKDRATLTELKLQKIEFYS